MKGLTSRAPRKQSCCGLCRKSKTPPAPGRGAWEENSQTLESRWFGAGLPRHWELATCLRLSGAGFGVGHMRHMNVVKSQLSFFLAVVPPHQVSVSTSVKWAGNRIIPTSTRLLGGQRDIMRSKCLLFCTAEKDFQPPNMFSLFSQTYFTLIREASCEFLIILTLPKVYWVSAVHQALFLVAAHGIFIAVCGTFIAAWGFF